MRFNIFNRTLVIELRLTNGQWYTVQELVDITKLNRGAVYAWASRAKFKRRKSLMKKWYFYEFYIPKDFLEAKIEKTKRKKGKVA